MNTNKTKQIVFTALMAAMCCVATMIVRIPSPAGGYVNLGDGLCLLSGLWLGPIWGGIAAGFGSALADLLSGYFVFAPVTFIIKGAIGVIGCLLYHSFARKWKLWAALVPACLIAELFTPVGYFIFERFLYGPAALTNVPGNLVQAAMGIVAACLLFPLLKKFFEEETHGNGSHS